MCLAFMNEMHSCTSLGGASWATNAGAAKFGGQEIVINVFFLAKTAVKFWLTCRSCTGS